MLELISRPVWLASKSPRRQDLLRRAGVSFEVVSADVPEDYPPSIPPEAVPAFISQAKAAPFVAQSHGRLVIAADTVVVLDGQILGKPADLADARRLLQQLSDRTHTVVSGVTLLADGHTHTFSEHTEVDFAPLPVAWIDHYLRTQPPLDKAGAYGVQEWIGLVGVRAIRGCYYNIMGLPVHRLMAELPGFLTQVPEAKS
jgi:septum formation protein